MKILVTALLILICIFLIPFIFTFFVQVICIRNFLKKILRIQNSYYQFQYYSNIAIDKGNSYPILITYGQESVTCKIVEFQYEMCEQLIAIIDDFYDYCNSYRNLLSLLSTYNEKTEAIKTIRQELSIWKLENEENA